MVKINVLCLLVVLFAVCAVSVHAVSGECPSSATHTQCSPRCLKDTECSSIGGKCCPNLCNYSSCVIPKAGNTGNNGYKGSGTGGAYCGNVKCSPFEKCEMDRTTKRMKCVRS